MGWRIDIPSHQAISQSRGPRQDCFLISRLWRDLSAARFQGYVTRLVKKRWRVYRDTIVEKAVFGGLACRIFKHRTEREEDKWSVQTEVLKPEEVFVNQWSNFMPPQISCIKGALRIYSSTVRLRENVNARSLLPLKWAVSPAVYLGVSSELATRQQSVSFSGRCT